MPKFRKCISTSDLAEGVGFEPTETHKTSTVFETVPFVHSGILPGGRLAGSGEGGIPQCFLKTLALRADARSVADANLFPDEAGFSPRPAWQVIEAARRRYLTGELTLPTTPATRIFLRDGLVYFAERSSDGTLPIRLMVEGVITREQMQRGTVIVNGVEHVGRMFDTDPSIDRASVELCVELFTDDVMIAVANELVPSYELTLYRRHPSGIDRWYPHSVPVTGRQGDTQDGSAATRAASDAAAAAKAAKSKPRPEVQASEVRRPEPQRTEARQPEAQPAAKAEVRQPESRQPEAQPAAKAEVRQPEVRQPEVRQPEAQQPEANPKYVNPKHSLRPKPKYGNPKHANPKHSLRPKPKHGNTRPSQRPRQRSRQRSRQSPRPKFASHKAGANTRAEARASKQPQCPADHAGGAGDGIRVVSGPAAADHAGRPHDLADHDTGAAGQHAAADRPDSGDRIFSRSRRGDHRRRGCRGHQAGLCRHGLRRLKPFRASCAGWRRSREASCLLPRRAPRPQRADDG